jgi:hypothetical protein
MPPGAMRRAHDKHVTGNGLPGIERPGPDTVSWQMRLTVAKWLQGASMDRGCRPPSRFFIAVIRGADDRSRVRCRHCKLPLVNRSAWPGLRKKSDKEIGRFEPISGLLDRSRQTAEQNRRSR